MERATPTECSNCGYFLGAEATRWPVEFMWGMEWVRLEGIKATLH